MENPPTNIPLEAKLRVLQSKLEASEKQNQETTRQLNQLLEGMQKFNANFITVFEARFNQLETRMEQSERLLRDELTGRIAMAIEPYLAKTANQIGDLNTQAAEISKYQAAAQKEAEKLYAAHQKKLEEVSLKLVTDLEKKGNSVINNLQNSHLGVQQDLENVSKYAAKILGEVNSVRDNQNNVIQAPTRMVQEIDNQIETWRRSTEMITEWCRSTQQEVIHKIDERSAHVRKYAADTVSSYKNAVRWSAFASASVSAFMAVISCVLLFSIFSSSSQNEIAKIKEFSDQQKQSIERIFAESVKSADLQNTDDQMRLKTYQFLLNRLPSQYRKDYDAELKMQYEQLKNARLAKYAARPQIAEVVDKKQ